MNGQLARFRHWGLAWIALTVSVAIHVADEATHGFLALYNQNAAAIRTRLPFLPIPIFTFDQWLMDLLAAVVILALLSSFAFRGAQKLRPFSYLYALLMILNGLAHAISSLYVRRLLPGVLSSPLLLATGAILIMTTRRARAASGTPRTALTELH